MEKKRKTSTKMRNAISKKKICVSHYRFIQQGGMKPYHTWKQEFMQDRCCSERDFVKELLVASIPHVLLNLLLIFYILLGTVILRHVDEAIGKEEFPSALLFTFTTITTIGYGNIHPTTNRGKLCCLFYCVIGIPLVILVLSNNGQFVVDAYLIIKKSFGNERTVSKGLPLWLSFVLLFLHFGVGGLIFSTWMGQMRFFDAVYCSFISVSTIGYGDLIPVPDTWTHALAIISFLSTGVIILSTLFQAFGCYVQYLHYIGRRFTGTKDVEIWFGGRVLTVQELITLVAEEFGVCPQRLRALLRDLDNILEAACHDTVTSHSESSYSNGEVVQNETRLMMLGEEKRPMLEASEQKKVTDVEAIPVCRIPSKSSMQLIVRDTENVVQALRVIHHKLNKVPNRQHEFQRQALEK
ncbi:Ion channel [Parelaphostrongylus tenuis]|nr:Ion channel [Parelaphostrongylus tenuis]